MKHKLFSLKFWLLVLLIISSTLTFISFLLPASFNYSNTKQLKEKFDTAFLAINSIEELNYLIDQKFKNSNYDTAQTVLYLDHFIRNRFYHSYSELSFHDNWIAKIAGTVFWSHFLNPVSPSDIIRYPMGACSQQGIIFQNQLNRLGIKCSTIEFYPLSENEPGHYAVSVYYNTAWHYYDSNKEPLIVDSAMPDISTIIDKKLYEKMYVSESNSVFQKYFVELSFQKINNIPFKTGPMYYFQLITGFLSHWLWLILLAIYFFLNKRSQNI